MSSKINSWVLASRPKTLFAAVPPVFTGSALALSEDKFTIEYSIVALLCSFLLQIGANFTNDLYDFLKGADTKERKGPKRVLASGLISVKEMKAGITIVFGLAFLLGMFLVYSVGVEILIVGIFSILAGLAYTAGPYPLAYHGLGDVFVFIFFGLVGTMGTYYLHTNHLTLLSFLVAIPVGLLITNLLLVNNYRDIDEDKVAGKNTLPVRFGRTFAKMQFAISVGVSFLIPVILFVFFGFSPWVFLPFLSLPIAIKTIESLYSLTGVELNKTLELTSKLSALFAVLFSIGMVI